MIEQKRNHEIDVLKGIGIVFVVLGHIPISQSLKYFIYSFHMPLFFFLSGYLFKPSGSKDFKDFAIGKVITLIIPYLTYLVLSSIIIRPYNFLNHSFHDNANYFSILIFGGNKLFGVFWFTTVLFITYLTAFLIFSRFSVSRLAYLFIFMLCGSYMFTRCNGHLYVPWSMDVVMHAFPFFVTGNYFNKMEDRIGNYWYLFSFLCCLVCVFFIEKISYDMKYSKYGVPFISYIYAVLFIILLKKFSKALLNVKLLGFVLMELGKASMVIMYLHLILLTIFKDKLGFSNSIVLFFLIISISYFSNIVFKMYSVSRLLFMGSKKDFNIFIQKK